MSIQEFKAKIKKEIAKDLKKAINEVEKYIRYDSELFDDFILCKGRFSKINKDYSSGIIQRDYLDIELNKIIKGLIDLVNNLSSNDVLFQKTNLKPIIEEPNQDKIISKYEKLEPGVFINKQNETKIAVSPTVFFDNRFGKAFPGVRGLRWFNNSENALYRLSLLLKPHLTFNKWENEADPKPIWWFRGNSNNSIRTFKIISKTKCLINSWEIEIERMAVSENSRYYKHFIYIQTKPEPPTNLYEYKKEHIDTMIDSFGYAFEEYGIIQGYNVTREEYDDGAAEVRGKVIESNGKAELRRRFLSKFNFIIAAKFSPYNSTECDMKSNPIFNKLVNNKAEIYDLIEVFEKLPRHELDC